MSKIQKLSAKQYHELRAKGIDPEEFFGVPVEVSVNSESPRVKTNDEHNAGGVNNAGDANSEHNADNANNVGNADTEKENFEPLKDLGIDLPNALSDAFDLFTGFISEVKDTYEEVAKEHEKAKNSEDVRAGKENSDTDNSGYDIDDEDAEDEFYEYYSRLKAEKAKQRKEREELKKLKELKAQRRAQEREAKAVADDKSGFDSHGNGAKTIKITPGVKVTYVSYSDKDKAEQDADSNVNNANTVHTANTNAGKGSEQPKTSESKQAPQFNPQMKVQDFIRNSGSLDEVIQHFVDAGITTDSNLRNKLEEEEREANEKLHRQEAEKAARERENVFFVADFFGSLGSATNDYKRNVQNSSPRNPNYAKDNLSADVSDIFKNFFNI